MRVLLAICTLWVGAACAEGGSLRFPDDFSPAPADATPELRVQMTVAEDGSLKAASVLESARPADNEAVLAALKQWRFPPVYRDDKPAQREG
ncbi:MAG: energy transducer TonB, partial [Solimonas sp.]